MSVLGQRFDIADAEMTRARLENSSECQGAQRRVAAGAAAANHQAIAVDFSAVNQPARSVHTIIDVDNSPLALQPFPISPAITGTAAVVNIKHCDATAGKILNP